MNDLKDNDIMPVQPYGWSGKEGVGPAFVLHEVIFMDGFLYLETSDMEFYLSKMEQFDAYSSGIQFVSDIRLNDEHYGLLFKLDKRFVKETLYVNGNKLDPKIFGGYLLGTPLTGEFDITIYHLSKELVLTELFYEDYICK